jgi:hypothetical protein
MAYEADMLAWTQARSMQARRTRKQVLPWLLLAFLFSAAALLLGDRALSGLVVPHAGQLAVAMLLAGSGSAFIAAFHWLGCSRSAA